jgi:ferrous iron transport protein A
MNMQNQTQLQTSSLLDIPCACELRVEELTGSPSLRSRLYAMGILPGTEMELCAPPCGKGSVCVRVRQCSLVLGESMARAILCRPTAVPPDGASASSGANVPGF